MAGDFLWGVKVLFDPTIKGGNYSAGAAGVALATVGAVTERSERTLTFFISLVIPSLALQDACMLT